MHICRIQEGYIWIPRGGIALLYKALQAPRKIGLIDKQILLLCDENNYQI